MTGRPNGSLGEGSDFQLDDQAEENLNEKRVREYQHALLAEKIIVEEGKDCPIASKLLDDEITRSQAEGRGPKREQKYVDIYHERPVRIAAKVLVPVKDHPKFNFVGKILGPKGNSLKRLQEDTMCRMAVLGRGSMKDRDKEEELRKSLDIKYAHLSEELHVEVSALAPPAEAYARIAFALTELQKFLIPDGGDDISKSQLKEMGIYEERPPKPRPRLPGQGGLLPRPTSGPQGLPPSTRPSGPRAPPRVPPASRAPPGKPRGTERRTYSQGQNTYDRNVNDSYKSETSYDDYTSSGPSRNFGGSHAQLSDYDNIYDDSFDDDNSDNQQWRPFKTGGSDSRSAGMRSAPEQPRYRSTPYSRPLNRT